MAISSETIRSDYDGNGVTTAFAVGFVYFDDDHLTVIHVDSDGVETTWVKGTEYTLSGDGSAGTGQVDVDTSPTDYTPASGESLVILLSPPNKQEVALPSGDYLDDIERMGDILQQQILNLLDGNNRALLVPLSEASISTLPTASDRASKFFAFDSSGGPIASSGTVGDSPIAVSTYMETLLDDGSASAARTTLGAQQDVITTQGDIVRGDSSGDAERLALGTSGYVLSSDGTDIAWADPPLPRSYLAGLNWSHGTDTSHEIDITVGECRNEDNDGNIRLTSTLTLDIEESGEDGLDTGSVASDSCYHMHLYVKPSDGSVHGVFSLSATSPTLPDSATSSRRIGAIRTDSSDNILGLSQNGDEVLLTDPDLTINVSNIGTDGVLRTMLVPTGVKVQAILAVYIHGGNSGDALYIFSPDVDDEGPSLTAAPLATVMVRQGTGADDGLAPITIRTNTSGQVRTHSTAAGLDLRMVTLGWVDRRGRDD